MAPLGVKLRKQPITPVHAEVLTPIDEEADEDDEDQDQPITMSIITIHTFIHSYIYLFT